MYLILLLEGSASVIPQKISNLCPHLSLETVFAANKLTQNFGTITTIFSFLKLAI